MNWPNESLMKPDSMPWPCFGLFIWIATTTDTRQGAFSKKLLQLRLGKRGDPDIRRTADELHDWLLREGGKNES